ncbi:bifunctional aminoglycoside phosphotransferase/ATP-binding protein [Algihabitans albus]|uniref:bifunctional aminoglycoside phosphotransferase/ATP-binding protein n=1 Tax=Algihabitans albus TaxID=2164067 RepID=UPI000E5C61AB|nr:bifunctional aminoglycoside phosphotransferase/ATP-binding protein [Algihabitans albus]
MTDQAGVSAFLGSGGSYDPPAAEVERIDTHAALVFLAGARAFKIKRAVRFSFMDFSTRDKRAAACRQEVRLNRRSAPDLYLGVVPILRRPGGFAFGDLLPDPDDEAALPQEIEELAVVMRRFDQSSLFDRLADSGRLDADLIEALVRQVVALHAQAEPAAAVFGGADGLDRLIAENAEDFAAYPEILPAERAARLIAACHARLEQVAALLDARRDGGFVRRCHGDLHLRNIVLLDGRPTLFDCIEFNAAIATIDLGYDLAFLLMDLDRRGLRPLANVALNRYLEAALPAGLGGPDWLAALPLFLSLRAAVRAKVAAPAVGAQQDAGLAAALRREALDYLSAAERYLAPPAPRLLAVGGLSGSGKSTLARALAPDLGASPGAVVLRSDQIRKRLAGLRETERLPAEAYGADSSAAVYAEIGRLAGAILASGHAVVVDAVSARPEERHSFRALAESAGLRFDGLWLEAPAGTLKARVAARQGDASDADAAVVDRQLGYDLGDLDWTRVPADGGPDAVRKRAQALLRMD